MRIFFWGYFPWHSEKTALESGQVIYWESIKKVGKKTFLHLRMLMGNHTCTDTHHDPYRIGNAVSRWKRHKYIRAIICSSHLCLTRNHDSTISFQIYSLPVPLFLHEAPISDILEPSSHIPHGAFSLLSFAVHGAFITHFGRKTFRPRPQDGVFKFITS